MKKNRIMRLASVLLVAVLLSTCAISGTYAKYVTTDSGSDTARVAYWGFNQTQDSKITITDLFKDTYTNVDSQNNEDVIAPGTRGSATFAFNYDGNTTKSITAPEVAYTFVVETTGSSCAQSIQNNPNILWRLNVTEGTAVTQGTWGTWTALLTAIGNLDGNKTDNEYAAGTLPEAFNNDQVYEIEWKWIFDESADNKETATKNNDTGDTAMGNATDLADVTITIAITATQVD